MHIFKKPEFFGVCYTVTLLGGILLQHPASFYTTSLAKDRLSNFELLRVNLNQKGTSTALLPLPKQKWLCFHFLIKLQHFMFERPVVLIIVLEEW